VSGNRVSRRSFLTGLGLTGLGAAAGAGGLTLAGCSTDDGDGGDTVPFRGGHQAGVTTPQQEHLHIVAFDVITGDRDALRAMLTDWTGMAERMTHGEETTDGGALSGTDVDGHGAGDTYKVPHRHRRGTRPVGGQPHRDGRLRPPPCSTTGSGLRDRRPRRTHPPCRSSPATSSSRDLCDGDIVIQACADDPQVAVHAVRNLTRAGSGVVEVRWSQLGYGAASKTTRDEDTPRNLFGFKDGTRNITADETGDIESNVWVGDDPDSAGPGGWMTGGVYMCTRRIRMLLEVWDRQVLDDQQHTFARYKGSGAPIGAEKEDDDVPFDLYLGTGGPAIPHDSHVYLAHPDQNNGRRMLRRAYNFIEGSDSFGHLSAGLFFIAYVTKPSENFTPIQLKLAHDDKMNEYVRYESKAVFACPPGLGDGDDWGTALFG
jgi:deferrochelatase/peroxidase EfeB